MLFAKVVLVLVILGAMALGFFMRVRAWRRRRAAEKAAWERSVAQSLRDIDR